MWREVAPLLASGHTVVATDLAGYGESFRPAPAQDHVPHGKRALAQDQVEAMAALGWGARYPMIAEAWRRDWEHIVPFLALPEALRRVVYTTSTIKAMHRQIRKAIKPAATSPTNRPPPS